MDSNKEKIKLIIIDLDGSEHSLEVVVENNVSLMDVLRDFGLTMGHCGGMALCASCHCIILDRDMSDSKSPEEEDMLYQLYNAEYKSRLICQIPLSKEIDGITIKLANN